MTLTANDNMQSEVCHTQHYSESKTTQKVTTSVSLFTLLLVHVIIHHLRSHIYHSLCLPLQA